MAFRSSSQTTRAAGVGTTLTGSAPSGTAANDYLAAFVVLDGVTADTVTPPAGWTSRGSFGFASGVPDGSHCEVFDKIATGSDSYAFSTNVNNACVLLIGAWSGRNTTTPRTFLTVATPNTTGNASPVSIALTSGTAAAGDDVAVFAMLDITVGTDTWGYTAPGSYTEQNDAQTTFATACLDTLDNVGAGALGTLTVTGTRSAGTGVAGWGGVVISIAAAPSSGSRLTNLAGPGKHPGPRRFAPVARGYPIVATDVTVALTGSSIAFSAGTLVPSLAVPLVGSAYAWSAGTLTPVFSLPLSGSAESYSIGALVPSISVALTGSAYTWSTGTMVGSTGGDLTLALTGSSISYSAGTLTPSSAISLTGSSESYSAGTLVATSIIALSGIAEAYSTGILSPTISVGLAGSLLAFSAGTMTATAGGDVTVALTGSGFAWAAGGLTPSGGDGQAASGGGAKPSQRQAEDRMLDALTRDMEFDNPVFRAASVEAPSEVSVEPAKVFSAEITPAVAEILAERDVTRKRVAMLLLLMAMME